MQLPKTIKRNLNDLTLSWKETYAYINSANQRYRLEISDETKEWRAIYCGSKTEYKIDRLAPCTCYEFRLKLDNGVWLNFKAATEDIGPYTSVMHLTRAVKLGKTSVIRKITNLRPDLLNAENKEHKTPIFQAIEAKDLQVLHLLITLGANVNKPLLYSLRTPLMFAIYKGELQAALFLLEKGARTSDTDINGLNIVHYAVDSNDLMNLEFALEYHLDINIQDFNGWTPLVRAVILNCSEEIIKYLLTHGADTHIKDKMGFDYWKHVDINKGFWK
ncbi:fibronectin type 3 and ankyrin repeat domains 1 protein-like [Euwallacea similis]|uniref:fibronectin type 3 and ankyrin repeat domains 1 protein-like n=1 Tax=Euwallacea similis TaxID=1736056 RepID=UPI00344CA205